MQRPAAPKVYTSSVAFFETGKAGDLLETPAMTFSKYPMKQGLSEKDEKKVMYLFDTCREIGMTYRQAHLTVGLADHESAGTWSENVKNNNGEMSVGIGQWNLNAGNVAPKTFELQAQKLCGDMKAKFDRYPEALAITKHNSPNRTTVKWTYVNKVLKSTALFK